MCVETSCYLCSDSKHLEGFRALTRTRQTCLASCHTRSPFYKEQCMKLMATMCFALRHKLTDALKKGYMALLAHIVDTDAVMVPVATLNNINPDILCVAFDHGHFLLQSIE